MLQRFSTRVAPAIGAAVAASSRTTAGLNTCNSNNTTVTPCRGVLSNPKEIDKKAIIDTITGRNIFCKDRVVQAVSEYFELGFDPTYTHNYPETVIAEHIYGYLCAKAEAYSGNEFEHVCTRDDFAFFFCTDEHSHQIRVMKELEEYITQRQKLQKTHAVSVRSYHATKSSDKTVLFTVSFDKFINEKPQAAIEKDGFPSLNTVSTESFLTTRSSEAQSRYNELLKLMHESISTSTFLITKAVDSSSDLVISIAFKADRPAYFGALSALLNEIPNITITKKFMESFSHGIQIYSFYCSGATKVQLEEKANLMCQLPYRPNNAITNLMNQNMITAEETVFCNCLMIFAFYFTPPAESEDYARVRAMVEKEPIGVTRLNNLRNSLNQEIMSERHLGDIISGNVDLVKEIFDDFKNGSTEESRQAIADKIRSRYEKDTHTRTILLSFLRFNEAVVKHNFFKNSKAAVAFRLNPAVFMSGLDFPRVPWGIFLFVGPHWRGFHVRFNDISRGGVRMIISDPRAYQQNKITLFQENYNLAFTQLLKNKDIPEGGSKGTILVSTRILGKLDSRDRQHIFQQYVDALQDVILPDQEGVVDKLGAREIIFLGPDENTAGHYPVIAAMHAKQRNYAQWKSFTTGKEPSLGGVPHDTYGMTTRSVRQCVTGIYRMLNLDESKLTKFQTGGPDGDLGSNEILMGHEITKAVVDGSGVIYDPEGLNRDELVRLAKARKMISEFDTSKLSAKGFRVLADKKRDESGEPIVLPDGTKVYKSVDFRNNFHFSDYIKTDIFVPCGGRPKSINLDNVHQLLLNHPLATGEQMLRGLVTDVKPEDLKFKYIVEGANLFITHDARIALERCGVVLIKDATANKGGVTSSSLEVFTGLALTDEEHERLMCEKDGQLSQFYKDMVEEICAIIERNARREFELIWKTSLEKPKLFRTDITDRLSRKIVDIRSFISESNLFEDKPFVRYILQNYTPKTLLKVVPVDELMKRVPENYQKAICCMWLASDYVYTKGFDSNEFDFYEFMQAHRSKVDKQE